MHTIAQDLVATDSAPATAPAAAQPPRGELVFFFGTMAAGKSTLALQMLHNRSSRGLRGLTFVRGDREGAQISSRIAPAVPAQVVDPDTDLHAVVAAESLRSRVDFVVCDEVQFFEPHHIDQLGRIADELAVEVLTFGLLADFRAQLFPASARLVAIADRREELQADARCWCGARATHNARLVDGVMVADGAQVVVGDIESGRPAQVRYEVVCRAHWRERRASA